MTSHSITPAALARQMATCALCCVLLASVSVRAAEPRAASERAGAHERTSVIDWQTSPLDLDLRGMNGERYAFHCPPGKPQPSRVAGSSPYTDDSSICTAAVHSGAIHAKDGGEVTIEIRPGQHGYAGSERNYIRSGDYNGRWDGSFVVVDAPDGTSTKGGNP